MFDDEGERPRGGDFYIETWLSDEFIRDAAIDWRQYLEEQLETQAALQGYELTGDVRIRQKPENLLAPWEMEANAKHGLQRYWAWAPAQKEAS